MHVNPNGKWKMHLIENVQWNIKIVSKISEKHYIIDFFLLYLLHFLLLHVSHPSSMTNTYTHDTHIYTHTDTQ